MIKDNEIIKALECCGKTGPCKGCPCYIDYEHTKCKEAYNGALDLIKRQQAEIERLKDYNENRIASNIGLSLGLLDEIKKMTEGV